MKYKVIYSSQAIKNLKKLDPSIRKMIIGWIEKNLIDCQNPRIYGKQLKGNYKDYWRYRIGTYRLITLIEDDQLLISDIAINHRKEIYN